MKNSFIEYLNESANVIENELKQYMSVGNDNGLLDPMSYSLLLGGKRIRPFIVIEAYRLFAKKINLKAPLSFASALEMIHTYSLIHDDLPCMDNDDMRRGKPTNHIVYGEAEALLAGDTLLTYAFEVLASNSYVSDKSIRLATIALSKCAGFSGMAGGQMIDLKSCDNIASFEELCTMHSLKTGALIRCAMLLGYYAATDEPDLKVVSDIESFATKIGIAFQVRDDILDVISDETTLGKPTGSDEKNNKKTSISFMSVEKAQEIVDNLTNEAITIIEKYYSSDCEMKPLVELAKYMVERRK